MNVLIQISATGIILALVGKCFLSCPFAHMSLTLTGLQIRMKLLPENQLAEQ